MPAEGSESFDSLAAIFEGEGIPPETEVTGSDLTLGGSPDGASAAAISRALEAAGFDLTGVEISVLPITGMDAALLVLDATDEAESLAAGGDGGEAFVKALLAAPEIKEASITQLVMTYRGADEQGPYVATSTISIATIEAALASGTNIGDQLKVQIDRSTA